MRGAVAVLAVLGLMPVRASAGMEVRTQSTGGRVGFEQADVRPIVFSVRSRCRDAAAEQYCAYLDVNYADGTHDWGTLVHFAPGTHGWRTAKGAFVPQKPVESVDFFGMFRDGIGDVEFADARVERREGTNEVLETFAFTDWPFSDSDVIERKLLCGRTVTNVLERTKPSRLKPPCPLADGDVRVWTADALCRVTPLTYPTADAGAGVSVDLARREAESAQVLVSAGRTVEDVRLEIGELKTPTGDAFRGDVKWERTGYVARQFGYRAHPYGAPSRERWLPGPLLPAAPFRVRAQSTQGTWLTVCAAADAKAGVYSAKVKVMRSDTLLAELPLTVRVRGFGLPERFGLRTAFSVMDGFTKKYYPDDFAARKRETWDLMLDHRLNPDDISRTTPPAIDDLVYARSRGMNSFNLLNIVPPARPDRTWVCYARPEQVFAPDFYTAFTNRIAAAVTDVRTRGLVQDAYIYGFDERDKDYFGGIGAFWRKWMRDFPDIPMLTTSKQFRHYALSGEEIGDVLSADAYCPIIQHFDPDAAVRLKEKGKRIWWYSSCQPRAPMPNFSSYESPLVEGRMLVGWLTWKYCLDGFLFWIVNRWDNGNVKLDESDTFFPGWRESAAVMRAGAPGDGTFMYPGRDHVLGSVRLSMLRDAEEDYEYLKMSAAKDTAPVVSLLDLPRASRPLLEARRRLADRLETAARKKPTTCDETVFASAEGIPAERTEILEFARASAYRLGFKADGKEAVCETSASEEIAGAGWSVPLNQSRSAAVRISAAGLAESIDRSATAWDLYADVTYADGSHDWGRRVRFDPSVSGWQDRTLLLVPEKPISGLGIYVRLCHARGRVRFRAPKVEVLSSAGDTGSFDGCPVVFSKVPSNPEFLIRDHASRSGFVRLREGDRALGVRLRVARRPDGDGTTRFGVSLEGDGEDDRALTLVYAVPLGKGDWRWCDGPRRTTAFGDLAADPFAGADAEVGARGQSLLPFGCTSDGSRGVALGIAPSHPAVYRVSANRRTGMLYIAFDLALTPEKPVARFGFSEFHFEGRDFFRGALEGYMRVNPAAFAVRAKEQGTWMAFAKISRVEGFGDFGFRFKEGDDEIEWDDRHGIATFHYEEPCTWWMKMPRRADGSPPTVADCLSEAERLRTAGDPKARRFFASRMLGPDGVPLGKVMDTPWCDGIVWSLNDAPGVGGADGSSEAKIGEAAVASRNPLREGADGLDGEYVDSSELWVTPSYDFNRANFAGMDTPLTFVRETSRPAVYKGLVAFEYCRAVAKRAHARDRLAMANAGPGKWCWNALQMDVMGTETNWRPRGEWKPPSDDSMILVRSIVGRKPYCYLMNTDFSKFTHSDSERYFNRCLAYGFYPGYFSADASTGHFFKDPKLYESVRDLYRRYLPAIRTVAEAGWRPVNRLMPVDPATGILVEQFGDRYVTVFNPSTNEVRKVEVRPSRDLVAGRRLAGAVEIPPETCLALCLGEE